MMIGFYFMLGLSMVATAPSTFNITPNTVQSQTIQTPEKKIYIDAKTGRIADNVDVKDLGTGKYIEANDKQYLFVDLSKEFSYEDNVVSLSPTNGAITMIAVQYEQYQQKFKDIDKQYNTVQGLEKDNILADAMKNIVDNKVNFPKKKYDYTSDKDRLKLSSLISVLGRDGLGSLALSSSSVQSNGTVTTPSSVTTTPTPVSSNANQIDALKALLAGTTNTDTSVLSTSTLASVGFDKTNTTNTDGSKTLGLSMRYKPGTLNPHNAYKNRKLNEISALLNTPDGQVAAVESIMKFTRMRRGGRIMKLAKNIIWSKELTKFSNERLVREFNKKMDLFVESRLSHLKKDPNSSDFKLAQQLENNIRLAFNQLIAKRIQSDTNAVINNISVNQSVVSPTVAPTILQNNPINSN